MDKKILKAAADTMRELGLSEVRIKDTETEIVLKREIAATVTAVPAVQQSAAQMSAPEEIIIEPAAADWAEVKSPLIGVFYEAAAPDAPPFVRPGDQVKKGDVLCIVEAMKMMNEICAETDGTIIDVCAENGALVEYGQLLFKIAEDK
ncbi:MAG: acetyl-CoA carboxylase biotin carboxyl carrier protein [Clostridiales bacterium]|jgi:acetyl-CoA carboxylase biotin carboxyl carrier protein|nr:acetyl-CoA carboxylase biotin carboxyl carrier protein [Clostridiales bacterium]